MIWYSPELNVFSILSVAGFQWSFEQNETDVKFNWLCDNGLESLTNADFAWFFVGQL